MSFIAISQSFDDVEIKATALTEDIFMLEGAGGNMALYVGDEDVFLIDDQFAELSTKILYAIDSLSGGKSIKYVCNTHWHGDHTGGNENLSKQGATIIAHTNVYERMSTRQFRGMGRFQEASPPAALPDLSFDDQMTIHIDTLEKVHLQHVHNAHTDGDVLIFFKEHNVLHMGDIFFHKRYPFIDLNSNGQIIGYINAVEKGLALADNNTQIIPGHGPLATKEDLYAYHAMLTDITFKVNKRKAAGEDLITIQEAGITVDYDEEYTWNFIDSDTFISFIYNSLPE